MKRSASAEKVEIPHSTREQELSLRRNASSEHPSHHHHRSTIPSQVNRRQVLLMPLPHSHIESRRGFMAVQQQQRNTFRQSNWRLGPTSTNTTRSSIVPDTVEARNFSIQRPFVKRRTGCGIKGPSTRTKHLGLIAQSSSQNYRSLRAVREPFYETIESLVVMWQICRRGAGT
ncbi:hypothetical protein N7G274_005138 [Stereocaulon virgatum]|uniref:Uncharacterized protein n=1 Tax=Stereocaulon virgatum TaxID=373712 RepID=A0ABR4A8Z4_9LECA